MSFFALIFLSFLTNQTEENETLKTPFEIFKKLKAFFVSVSENCFLFLRTKDTQKHVWQLFPVFLNLFFVFLIWWFWRTISSWFLCFLYCERKKKKTQKIMEYKKKNTRGEQKNHSHRINHKPSKYVSYNKFNQIPNPHREQTHKPSNLCSQNFLFQMRKLISYNVGNGGNVAIWTSHGQRRWVNICVCERDKRTEKWRCWDEKGREECGLCGMRGRDREKKDGWDRFQEKKKVQMKN